MDKLNVFLTVDVEVSPSLYRKVGMEDAYRRCILGETSIGGFGLPYQLKILKEYGLKATFFVEPLFSLGGYEDLLKKTVDLILSAGQDVQLHLHTEWLELFGLSFRADPGRTGDNMADFSERIQTEIISLGQEKLYECGVACINGFRAGNYGANLNTMRALVKNGIYLDTSYNYPYLTNDCELYMPQPLVQPKSIENVYEIPISFFQQIPGSFRHVQIIACSFAEISKLMVIAWKKRWYSFVVVSHSFELINRSVPCQIPIAKRRFDQLCKFQYLNSDKFMSKSFGSIERDQIPTDLSGDYLRSNILETIRRCGEQLIKRLQ